MRRLPTRIICIFESEVRTFPRVQGNRTAWLWEGEDKERTPLAFQVGKNLSVTITGTPRSSGKFTSLAMNSRLGLGCYLGS